jgi:UDP-N-acetylmuramoylalanine--D-glutamate ligase
VLVDATALPLPGLHNRQNALAAAVACRATGVPLDAVRRGLLSFKGLPHRIQEVAQVGGVRYVDDSKATNVGSVLVALRAVSETLPAGQKIIVLLGGRDKDSDFSPLAPALTALGALAVTFGEAGPLIADALAREGFTGHRAGTLTDAIQAARGFANPGDVVLLSPACASFDAFTSYAARGDAFAAEIRRFAEEPA